MSVHANLGCRCGADATQAAARANHAKNAAKDARDDIKDANALMEDAIKFLRQYLSSKDEEAKATLHAT